MIRIPFESWFRLPFKPEFFRVLLIFSTAAEVENTSLRRWSPSFLISPAVLIYDCFTYPHLFSPSSGLIRTRKWRAPSWLDWLGVRLLIKILEALWFEAGYRMLLLLHAIETEIWAPTVWVAHSQVLRNPINSFCQMFLTLVAFKRPLKICCDALFNKQLIK